MKDKGNERLKAAETLAILALAALVGGRVFHWEQGPALAAVLLAVGLFVRPLAVLIHRGWMAFAVGIGAVNSRILLGLLFYVFLVPLSLVYRVFNRDPIGLRRKNGGGRTYWITRDHAYTGADLKNPW